MRRSLLFFILMAGLFLVAAAAGAGISVAVPSGTVGEGKTISLPVTVSGASSLGAMDMTVSYDPSVLSFTRAELGALSTNGIVEANEIQPGFTKISFADTKGISGDGDVLKITFTAAGKKGTSTRLTVAAQAYGLDLKDIPTTASGGTVSVSSPGLSIGLAAILLALLCAVVVFGKRRE